MSQHNILSEIQSLVAYSRLEKTATATLTDKEVMAYRFIDGNHASEAIALTLPVAGNGNKGAIVTITDYGVIAVTVETTGTVGFGGAGATKETLTLERGEAVTVHSNGSYWFQESNDTAGS